MEPSGLMDFSRSYIHRDVAREKRGPCGQSRFVYDVADEEVHFTKNPLPGGAILFSVSQGKPQPTSPISLSFSDVSLGSQTQDVPVMTDEQARSSRLMNSIGSKLRRGSNILVTPKLVGQYLLGITIRSWSEFLNTSRMLKAPTNTHQLTRRLASNLSYFQGNYLCVSLVLLIYCILTSPLLLLAIAGYISALYFVTSRSASGRQIQLLGFKPNLQQQYSFLTLISLPLLWVAGAPSAIFWIIGASFVVVGLHASMYLGEKAFQELPISSEQKMINSGVGASQGGNLGFRASQVPYYAHHPIPSASSHYQYITPPSVPAQDTQSGNSHHKQPGYSAAISHWMSFGRQQSGNQHVQTQPANLSKQRVPDVTIISHDFAGLGRVYEV